MALVQHGATKGSRSAARATDVSMWHSASGRACAAAAFRTVQQRSLVLLLGQLMSVQHGIEPVLVLVLLLLLHVPPSAHIEVHKCADAHLQTHPSKVPQRMEAYIYILHIPTWHNPPFPPSLTSHTSTLTFARHDSYKVA